MVAAACGGMRVELSMPPKAATTNARVCTTAMQGSIHQMTVHPLKCKAGLH